MIFVVLFWIAIFIVIMRVLTWINRHHPKFRNVAALVVEVGAAIAIAEALTNVGAVATGLSSSPKLLVNALFLIVIGGAAHFFASNTARSAQVVYPPFVAIGLIALAGMPNTFLRLFVGLGMIGIGVVTGWLKYRSSRQIVKPGPADVPQA